MYRCFFKRVFDIVISSLLIMILSPLLLAVSIILFFINGRRVFFLQIRPGYREIPFPIIKFRTMNDEKDENGNLMPDDQRLTNFGKLIRKTSIDELPQLFNVIKGDLSLIGPRPLLMEYLPLYNREQARRHEVRPGITGWAQVNGRNAISWQEKFKYDVWYVDNMSLLLDLKIIFITVKKVLIGGGINSDTSETMEKFTGN